jgi:hypothetical protein
MPAPRILQAFIPFQVVMRAFDKGRPPLERIGYGALTLVFVAALTGGIIRAVGGELAISDMIRYGIIWIYALVQLYVMGYAAISFTRQGIALGPTNRLKSIGYCTLGITCGILAAALTIGLGFVITQQY